LKTLPSDQRALLFGLGAVLSWSTVATAFKIALSLVDTYQLLFLATFTASVILLVLVLFKFGVTTLIRNFCSHWKLTLLAGLLNPIVYYHLLFRAYDLLPAQVALSINYSWAIVLTLMAVVFLKQKIQRIDLVTAGICYVGVVIIATGGDFTSLQLADSQGVVLALLSTFVWAAYWILNIKDGREPMVGLSLNFLVALPVTAVGCYVFSDFAVPFNGVLAASYVGVAEMAAGFVFWSTALKLSSNASRVSNLVFLSPFISLVFIHFILEEPVTPATLFGLMLIVTGLICQQLVHESSEKGGAT
jgi:drug/metabolite transporter (DMT)-like permease